MTTLSRTVAREIAVLMPGGGRKTFAMELTADGLWLRASGERWWRGLPWTEVLVATTPTTAYPDGRTEGYPELADAEPDARHGTETPGLREVERNVTIGRTEYLLVLNVRGLWLRPARQREEGGWRYADATELAVNAQKTARVS